MNKMDKSTAGKADGHVLILGGSSDIGRAVAAAYAARGWHITLAARDVSTAERNASDVQTRHHGAKIVVRPLDILKTPSFKELIDSPKTLPDTIVCLVGMLGDQQSAQDDPIHASQVIRTNFEGPALLLEMFAQRFAARGNGLIIGVSSVAGDRGRASNYVYGAAKAGFSAYLSGLRNRLSETNVRVVTVKPGFVDTRMTRDMDLPNVLTAKPEDVANRIMSLQDRPADVVYVLRIWCLVMFVIRALPERIFKKLKL